MFIFVLAGYIFELEQLFRYFVSTLAQNERDRTRHRTPAVVLPFQMR